MGVDTRNQTPSVNSYSAPDQPPKNPNEAARRRVVDFVARFAKAADGLAHVQVTSFDADSVKDCWESDDDQACDLRSRMASNTKLRCG